MKSTVGVTCPLTCVFAKAVCVDRHKLSAYLALFGRLLICGPVCSHLKGFAAFWLQGRATQRDNDDDDDVCTAFPLAAAPSCKEEASGNYKFCAAFLRRHAESNCITFNVDFLMAQAATVQTSVP